MKRYANKFQMKHEIHLPAARMSNSEEIANTVFGGL